MRSVIEPISISTKDAAKATGIPQRTMQEHAKNKTCPAARRIGKRYVFVVAELKQWIIDGGVAAEGQSHGNAV